MDLLIEGWRGINHSFALVNQWQLLYLSTALPRSRNNYSPPVWAPHGPSFWSFWWSASSKSWVAQVSHQSFYFQYCPWALGYWWSSFWWLCQTMLWKFAPPLPFTSRAQGPQVAWSLVAIIAAVFWKPSRPWSSGSRHPSDWPLFGQPRSHAWLLTFSQLKICNCQF